MGFKKIKPLVLGAMGFLPPGDEVKGMTVNKKIVEMAFTRRLLAFWGYAKGDALRRQKHD